MFTTAQDGHSRIPLTTIPAGSPTPGEAQVFLDTRASVTMGWSASFENLEALAAG